MTTIADRIVEISRAELGVAEQPPGSNTGPRVIEYQSTTSLAKTDPTGWAWCDAFYRWLQEQAGVPAEQNVGSASTDVTCQLAHARGWIRATPAIGAGIIWCGKHIGTVVGIGDGVVYTVEGNSGDAVTAHTRAIAGAMFIVPPYLGTVLVPPRIYWIDDPGATYVIRGPWAREKSAEKVKAGLSEALQRRAEILHTGEGKYVLRIGEPPRRGPFLDEAKRDQKLARLEKTLVRKLVPRSTVSKLPATVPASTPAGPAEGLGKTT